VAIASGLRGGERVVISPSTDIAEGARVRIAAPGAAAAPEGS
jgi:hypothetical protein